MVPDPSTLGRRQVLAGLAGVGAAVGGGTLAVGATEPTALPDFLTDEATKHYPTPPEVTTYWRPTVTEAHAREVVDLLARTVEEGKELWAKVETERHFTGAGGWLESAREELRNGIYHEALWNATYGLRFAAEDLGRARAKLGRGDLQALAKRGIALRDRSASVARDLEPYPVDDPGVDLAWYLRIEQEALMGEHLAVWGDVEAAKNGVDDEDGPDTSDLDPWQVGEITSSVLRAQVHVRNAERYRDHLFEKVDGDATPYADHLSTVADEFRAALEGTPTRDEVLARYGVEDPESIGPYEFAHTRLADWCYRTGIPTPWTVDIDEQLRVLTAVALSKGVARIRAHEFAVDHMVVDEGDEGFDSGHTLAEKRRARAVHQSVIGSEPPPLLTRQAGRAIEDLQVAVVGFADSYQHPIWRERLKAYLYALIGRAKLKQYPAVYETIVGRD